MKISKLVLIAIAALVSFTACQKELNFDNGGVSFGSLKSAATGDCLPSTLYGIYKKDSVLTSDNYIDVQVSVLIPGTFDIRSDTLNGYSFSKTGNVGSGLNTIRLYASGKPVASGTNTFTIRYDSSVCTFSVTVITSTAGGAIYTFGGAPGTCSNGGVPPTGTYTAGIAMTAANTVTMSVNVTSTGTYALMTTANGVTFSASGIFSSPGVQTITFTASGTPSATANTYTYPVTNGSSNCSFTITYTASGSAAVYTLSGAPGSCTPATVHGTYTAGTALTTANNIDVQVNVITPGSYTLSTDLQNGMRFTSSGTFSSTGLKTVTLLPAPGSNPITGNITTTMTPQIGTSACTFDIPVVAPSDRVYTFKIGTTTYTGPCSGALLGSVPDAMSITGGSGANLFSLTLNNQTGAVTTGAYSGTSLAGKYASLQYSEGIPTPTFILIGDPNLPVPFTTNLSATITSLDMVNKVVQGTFSGTVRDATFALVTITNGTFKADF